MADLLQVPTEDVAKTWPWLEDRIAFGVEHSRDRMTLAGLHQKAMSGEWDLHLIYADDDEAGTEKLTKERIRAVLFTQCYKEMGGDQVLSVRFLAGVNKVGWLWLIDALELFALRNGCSLMSIPGRRGWARDLKDYGYRQEAVVLEKRLKAIDHAGTERTHGSKPAEHRSGGPRAVQPGIHERRQSA